MIRYFIAYFYTDRLDRLQIKNGFFHLEGVMDETMINEIQRELANQHQRTCTIISFQLMPNHG